jgi:hypothetical protein
MNTANSRVYKVGGVARCLSKLILLLSLVFCSHCRNSNDANDANEVPQQRSSSVASDYIVEALQTVVWWNDILRARVQINTERALKLLVRTDHIWRDIENVCAQDTDTAKKLTEMLQNHSVRRHLHDRILAVCHLFWDGTDPFALLDSKLYESQTLPRILVDLSRGLALKSVSLPELKDNTLRQATGSNFADIKLYSKLYDSRKEIWDTIENDKLDEKERRQATRFFGFLGFWPLSSFAISQETIDQMSSGKHQKSASRKGE